LQEHQVLDFEVALWTILPATVAVRSAAVLASFAANYDRASRVEDTFSAINNWSCMFFDLFKKKKAGKDEYLEKVASILHSTIGPMMPMQNAYDLAEECLGELKGNISKGMFHDGANPRESVMAYYSLCSMVRETSLNDDRSTVLKISVMARVLAGQFKNQLDLTQLEKGICLFGEQALSDSPPKHTVEDVAKIKLRAAEIIFTLVNEQGASVTQDDLLKLITNVSANIGDVDICKAGDKLLALSALTSVTAYSIDQGDIPMANVYANCVGAAFNKYVKDQKHTFDDYQNDALRTIVDGYGPVVQELMKCNTRANEAG
jgi:hypothetical protein